MELQDKVAIVTGGLGGIGRAVSISLLENGAKVAVIDVKENMEWPVPYSVGDVTIIRSDISVPGGAEDAVRRIIERHSSVDILVNTAGIQGPIGPFACADMDRWAFTIGVNLLGTVQCCRAVLPHMTTKKCGKIVNFAGGGANFSRPNFSAYAVSKAGVVRFTEILADELKASNIQVNAVAPGVINTRMITKILDAGIEKAGSEYEQIRSRIKKGFDSPEAVADLVCWLASENSNWLSGKLISAVWDPWREWKKNGPETLAPDMYTLRRVDGRHILTSKT